MQDTDNQNSYLGRFWLPQQDEKTAIPGVMELGEAGATVRLDGALSETGLLADVIVFARLQGRHTKATLFNCFASASKRGDGTVVASKLDSTLVALGSLSEDLGGHVVQFQLPGSRMWFHERCFDVQFGESSEVTVRFNAYESSKYPLADGLTLERYYSATVPMGGWGAERFEIHRPMGFRIFTPTRLDFDRLWVMMSRLRRFLEFLSQHPFPHTNLLIFEDADIVHGTPGIEIRNSSIRTVKPKRFEWDEQLARFDEIQERFPQLLQRWFVVHQAYPEPFSRYFAAFDHDRADVILHFLWNVAALEELHKLRTTRASKNKKGFDLLDRLKEIRERWSTAFEHLPSDAVLEQIKDSRHYYAHAAGDLKDKAAKDWILLRYADFVSALCNLEILALLGFSNKEAIKLANQYPMRESLALTKYPTA